MTQTDAIADSVGNTSSCIGIRSLAWWSLIGLALFLVWPSVVWADDTPPVLTRLQLESFMVDSDTQPAFVRLEIDLQDSDSEVCLEVCDDVGGPTQVKLRHVASGQRRNGFFELRSGDLLAGTFAAAVALPATSAGGIWEVEEIWAADVAGNRARFSTSDLASLPALTAVLNQGEGGDATPPSLTSVTVDPFIIDSTADTSVEVTLIATDSQSGLCLNGCADHGGPTQIRYVHAPTGQVRDGLFVPDGPARYLASVEFPSGSAGGSWRVAALQLVDLAGNRVSFSRAELDALGSSTALFNQSVVGDNAAPTLVSLSFDPDPVDTTMGPRAVQVTLEATDDRSGTCDVPWCGDFGTTTQVQFRRADSDHVRHGLFTLIGAGPVGQVYRATVELPESTQSGVWEPDTILLADRVGNRVFVPEPGFVGNIAALALFSALSRRRRLTTARSNS